VDKHSAHLLAQGPRAGTLDEDAIMATLRQIALLTSSSMLAMSFLLPIESMDPESMIPILKAAA